MNSQLHSIAMKYISWILVVAYSAGALHVSVDHVGVRHVHLDDTNFSKDDHSHFDEVVAEHATHEHPASGHDSVGHRHELGAAKVCSLVSPKILGSAWDCMRVEVRQSVHLLSVRDKGREDPSPPRTPVYVLSQSFLI